MSVSSIYNHRPMQPTNTRPNPTPANGQPQSAFNVVEAVDTIRHEYDALQAEVNDMRHQRNELEVKLDSQMAELNHIRKALYDLELKHGRIRQTYEDELNRLRGASDIQGGRVINSSLPLFNMPHRSPGRPSPTGSHIPGPSDIVTKRPFARSQDNEIEENRKPEPGLPNAKRQKAEGSFQDASSSSMALKSTSSLRRSPSDDVTGPSFPTETKVPNPEITAVIDSFSKILDRAPPQFRKEHTDWMALYNPKVKKSLDVNVVHTFNHSSVVCAVQFSLDGRYLAVGCNNVTYIYDVQSGAKLSALQNEPTIPPTDFYVRTIRFSPDGKFLATGSEDHKIRIWNLGMRKIIWALDGHHSEIYSIDYSSDGRYIVSGSADKTMRIWYTSDYSSRIIDVQSAKKNADLSTNADDDCGVTSVAISPDSTLIATGSLDHSVCIWDISTGDLLESMKGHEDSVYSVAWTPDGKSLISGSLDRTLLYWDLSELVKRVKHPRRVSTSQVIVGKNMSYSMRFIAHKDFVLSACFTADSRWVISGSKDRTVNFWDARTSELQFTLCGHKNSVISLALNPLGGMLATGSGDLTARIWTYSAI